MGNSHFVVMCIRGAHDFARARHYLAVVGCGYGALMALWLVATFVGYFFGIDLSRDAILRMIATR